MIYELVLRNFDCSLEFVFSLLLFQPFNFSPVSFACNFQDWGCVILREIDFLLKICWSIPCLHPLWKVHTRIEICASLNHRKKTKADGSRLIPRKHTETLVLLSVANRHVDVSYWRMQARHPLLLSLGGPYGGNNKRAKNGNNISITSATEWLRHWQTNIWNVVVCAKHQLAFLRTKDFGA